MSFAAWDYWRVSELYLPQDNRATAYRDGTLDKVRISWLFQDQVQFAELTTTPLTAANAAQFHAKAKRLLHFSPEPRVVEKLIESAVMLGRNDEALFYLQRFQVVFPQEHVRWKEESTRHETPWLNSSDVSSYSPCLGLVGIGHPFAVQHGGGYSGSSIGLFCLVSVSLQ